MTSTPSHTAMIALAFAIAAISSPRVLAQSDEQSATTLETLRFDDLSMPIDLFNSFSPTSDEEGGEKHVPREQPRLSLGVLNEMSLQTESSEGWSYTLSPYMYLTGIDGSASIAGTEADIDLSFSDIFSDFDVIAFSVRFEAWKDQKWGLIFDGMYLDVDGEFPFPDPMFEKISIDIVQAQVDFGLGYRVYDQDLVADDAQKKRLVIDVIGGMRYQYLKEELKIDTEPTLGDSNDWLEIFIGGRAVLQIDEKWTLALRGDASGFGIGSASDLTWNLLAGFEYRFKPTQAVRVGYKVQGFDYSTGSGITEFGADWTTQGLYLAIAFDF